MKYTKILLTVAAVSISTATFAGSLYPTFTVRAVEGAGFSKLDHSKDPTLWVSRTYQIPANGNGGGAGSVISHLSATRINETSATTIHHIGALLKGYVNLTFKITGQNTGIVYYTCTQSVPISIHMQNKTYTLLLTGVGTNECRLETH